MRPQPTPTAEQFAEMGAFNAQLVSADTREAENLKGVTVVKDGNFIGVAAPSAQIAMRAAGLIKAEWKAPAQPSEIDPTAR